MSMLYRNDTRGEHPQSWYAQTAEIDPLRPALEGATRADVVIVGAGYTGLNAALALAEAGMDVAVVEAHRAGFGASGRNGGQVSSGFNKDQLWFEKTLGRDSARILWDIAEDAKALVRDNVARHAPEARFTPGVAHGAWTEAEMRDLREYAEYLARAYGYEQDEVLEGDAFRDIVRSPVYKGGVLDMGAGHVHPLRYVLGLARAAEAAGVRIYEMTEATRIDHGAQVIVDTDNGEVRADFAVLAGNGYLSGLAPKVTARVMPINSFIVATAPLGNRAGDVLSRDIAVADSRFVVNYFRLSEDGRFLFGGRESYGYDFPQNLTARVRKRMSKLFPQIADIEFEHAWGGTLGITMNRLPCLMRVAPNVLSASGFSGHGVALASMSGRIMAEAILGQAGRFDVMESIPHRPFPGGERMRAPLLTAGMTWYALRDRLGI